MTTLRVLLHVAAQCDYELYSLEFSSAFLQGSLHEEIWLCRPPGFTGTTLVALGFAPSTADPSLFLHTDTSLPPFYILVYVDDLVFATADTEALPLVKSELHKRHTCTDLGPSALWLHLVLAIVHSPGYSTSGMGLVLGGRSSAVLTGHSDAFWVAIALCQEHRLEHRMKHIALRYFLARELQQHGQLRVAHVPTWTNKADVFTKALPAGDHQRFCTALGLVPTFPHLLDRLQLPRYPTPCPALRRQRAPCPALPCVTLLVYALPLVALPRACPALPRVALPRARTDLPRVALPRARPALPRVALSRARPAMPRVALPRVPRALLPCASCLAAANASRSTAPCVAPCCSPHVAPCCLARRALRQPARRALLPRASCSAAARASRPAAPRIAPCCPARRALLQPARRALLTCTVRALLPTPPRPSHPGARPGGAGAVGAGGVAGSGAGGAGAGGAGAGGAGAGATRAAGGAGAAGTRTGGAGACGTGAGGIAQPRLFFAPPSPSSLPPPDSVLCRVLSFPSSTGLPLQPGSPLPAPSPYTEQTDSLTECRELASRPASPVRAVRTGHRVPRQHPPRVPGTHTMTLCPSSVPQRLVDFAAACRLNYAASLVAESESVWPPSIGGECALGTDALEDRQEDFECLATAVPHLVAMLLAPEGDPDALDIPTPRSYAEAITGPYSSQWQAAMDAEMASWKRPPGSPPRDYELHSLDFSTFFLHGSLHEEIWPCRLPGFTRSFPACTQWSLRRPVYGLHLAPREWHDTLRTTIAALGFAPSTADPSLFLRTDTSLPPFYILVYVDDLVFATADTKALALVKSELQKRHTCTDLGELRSYLGLQITQDGARRTICYNVMND
ncbi:unnamed protein product [Closterium sp. NIES-53]